MRAGGLSGPAIKPIALKKVYDVYQVSKKHGVPIMGQGGISSPEDAIEFILAGASTVGVGTALFFDPLVCNKINQGLDEASILISKLAEYGVTMSQVTDKLLSDGIAAFAQSFEDVLLGIDERCQGFTTAV